MVFALAVPAVFTWGRLRTVLGGAALGVAIHLCRDVATAPVALMWPWSNAGQRISYWVYALTLAAASVLSCVCRRSS